MCFLFIVFCIKERRPPSPCSVANRHWHIWCTCCQTNNATKHQSPKKTETPLRAERNVQETQLSDCQPLNLACLCYTYGKLEYWERKAVSALARQLTQAREKPEETGGKIGHRGVESDPWDCYSWFWLWFGFDWFGCFRCGLGWFWFVLEERKPDKATLCQAALS